MKKNELYEKRDAKRKEEHEEKKKKTRKKQLSMYMQIKEANDSA
jgi:ribosomal protein S21